MARRAAPSLESVYLFMGVRTNDSEWTQASSRGDLVVCLLRSHAPLKLPYCPVCKHSGSIHTQAFQCRQVMIISSMADMPGK
jgi:hypothetical protein